MHSQNADLSYHVQEIKNMFYETTMTLTFDHPNLISPSEHMCQKDSFEPFLR